MTALCTVRGYEELDQRELSWLKTNARKKRRMKKKKKRMLATSVPELAHHETTLRLVAEGCELG